MKRNKYHLKVHDRYQVELKFDFPISPSRKREDIQVETFFFIPNALDVTSANYKREYFYQDLQTYTRYGTPVIPLAELVNPANEYSPLIRVHTMKADLAAGAAGAPVAERAEYELRILACIFRGETREQEKLVSAILGKPRSSPKDYQDAAYLAEKFLDDAARVLKYLRAMQREFLNPHLPENVDRAFRYADEAMSVQLESVCGKAYRAFAKAAREASPEALDAARRLAATMQNEEAYRRQAGYPTLVDATNGPEAARKNEYFLYRSGVLKKYAQSTLFLSVQMQQGSRSVLTTISALAAMAGMAFFIFVLWFLEGVAPVDSMPYMFLVIVVYAFRENIKEQFKGYLSQRMTGLLRDRERHLIDRGPSKSLVGRAGEAFSFVPMDRVPERVRRLRAPDEMDELAEEGAPESVIKFQKSITLYADRVFRIHKRVTSLNEITRFNVRRLLLRMDDPKKGLALVESMDTEHWDTPGLQAPRAQAPANGEARKDGSSQEEALARSTALSTLLRVGATKVYHVNMILLVRSRAPDGTWVEEMEKFRLVLSREGIERVEANGFERMGESRLESPGAEAVELHAQPMGLAPAAVFEKK
ncbi:MAG: hypothetical protein HY291_12670 [Planctomycetes bacterium]|nr:hypothetical protein [Planctomycetota bacterium]